MSDATADPTIDRLLRHMAWANAKVIDRLAELSDDALALASPRNEWTVASILDHLVDWPVGTPRVWRACLARSGPNRRPRSPSSPRSAVRCAAHDARLRAQAALPDGLVEFPNRGKPPRARSTVLGQAIHHATEHRAQIAGALATNGIDAIDLDALDVWAYGDAEGLGA